MPRQARRSKLKRTKAVVAGPGFWLKFAFCSPKIGSLWQSVSRSAASGELTMLNVTVKDLSDAVMLQCSGRLVHGEETALLCAAVQQHGRTVILDLQEVDTIDAAGIGVLVSLQAA